MQDDDRPVVAVFDFDGTLTDRGSVWPYLVAQRGRLRVALAAVVVAPRLLAAALLGGRHADRAKEMLFVRVLSGVELVEVHARSIDFATRHYSRHARRDMAQRLRWHRESGHRIVIVSASPELSIEPLGELVGADAVLATKLAVDGCGELTGHYDGRNCRGIEKRMRLEAWIAEHAGEDAYIWAYGNSAGDRDMLAFADVGVDAGKLGRFGKLRRFRRLADVAHETG